MKIHSTPKWQLSQKAKNSFDISHSTEGELRIVIRPEWASEFRQLVVRGYNTWDQASAEMKQFCDLILRGEIIQDYSTQGHIKPMPE